ncbi:MAG: ECF transporter S component [bacterium]|nr:ECF transporter S component [bacterium]
MTAPRQPTANRSVRQPVLLGLFAGVAVGVGYLLAGVPNVELMTLVIMLAGATLGAVRGAAVGVVAEAIFSVGSPYGMAAPPLLAAQLAGMALAGVTGAALRMALERTDRPARRTVTAGVVGASTALVFDLLTNVGSIIGYELDPRLVFGGALGFNLIHMASVATATAAVFPALAPRLRLLVRSSLVGRTAPLVLAILLTGGVAESRAQGAPTDSTGLALPDTATTTAATQPTSDLPAPTEGPGVELGWERPLWQPFAWDILDWYDWYSPYLAVREAGLGGAAVVFGEAGTSPAPLVTVDDVPWGTGHALVDDPWLAPIQGLEVGTDGWFTDGLGGTAGRLNLRTADPDPEKAVSEYRGVKGRHESYMRGIHVLTPRADWRASLSFDEVIDKEAWNYTDVSDEERYLLVDPEFPGHGKVRQSRTRISRLLDDETGLDLEISNGRVTRDDAPAWGALHREVWDTGLAATAYGRRAGLRWRTILHWRDRDVQWGARPTGVDSTENHRKLGSSREGLILSLRQAQSAPPALPDSAAGDSTVPPAPFAVEGPGGLFLNLTVHNWRVVDTVDILATLRPEVGETSGHGQTATLDLGDELTLGPVRVEAALGGRWDDHAGVAPAGRLAVGGAGDRPAWRLEIARDGRGPRSDELLTLVDRPAGLGDTATMLPNPDLGHENTLRAGLAVNLALLGNELALNAGARRLRDGIAWEPLPGEDFVGRWENGLEMDSVRLTARLARQGRFLGWGRIMLEGTWRAFDEKMGQAPSLPPKDTYRLHLMWENHFFQEDGVLQLGLISTRRGAMDDPWDITRTTHLPARTVHDLLVGFRLVGVELSLAFRNLQGERVPLSYLTNSSGQEVDMRLRWAFRY